MKEAWLIYNFGTQEPRIKVSGEFIPLKDRGQALASHLGVNEANGLWESAMIVNSNPGSHQLAFPILKPALDYVRCQTSTGLTQVKLIATKSSHHEGLDPDDPCRDDTYWAAMLGKRWIEGEYTGLQVEVLPLLDDRPHLYSNAKELLLASGLLDGVGTETVLYICSSPGLPAVNSAVLQHVLHRHSGQCFVFQVEEPERDRARREEGGGGKVQQVAETEMFLDLAAKQFIVMVKEFQYKSALELLKQLPSGPKRSKDGIRALLEEAVRYWNLEFSVDPLLDLNQQYLPKVYAAIRIGSVLLGRKQHLNDAVSWLADGCSLLMALLVAKEFKDPVYVIKGKTHPELPKDTLKKWEAFWKDLTHLQLLVKARNDFVHRFEPMDEAKLLAALVKIGSLKRGECFSHLPARIEAIVDKVAIELKVENLERIKADVPNFQQLNQKILSAIDQDLIGPAR